MRRVKVDHSRVYDLENGQPLKCPYHTGIDKLNSNINPASYWDFFCCDTMCTAFHLRPKVHSKASYNPISNEINYYDERSSDVKVCHCGRGNFYIGEIC